MHCPRCQHENPSGQKFCGECGTRLAAACSACGASNPPVQKFCGECGTALTGAGTSRQFATPESYTPKHLAERILTSKAALEGERKLVTVLFADLKGSMELLADRDPEEARKLLDPVLERMMEAVHRYEGTVNQVMGDGIMALFGAPVAHEDHAVRACYAALRMQESVKQYAEGVRREDGITLRIRVGLNSGEVVVRTIGSDLHMDYTAVGQTTHLAARLEQLADPGSTLLAPGTLTLAEGFIQVVALGPMAVRGLPAPVDVYELTGASAVRSRLQATATRGLSRFVGRDVESEQLRRTLEQARHGRGQLAALVGEPGVGKSRLVFELTRSHRVDGWLVLEAGSVSYGKATSYLPVIELLKPYFRIGDRDTYRDIREKVTGRLLTLDRGLEPNLPALLSVFGVPSEDPQWAAIDPSQRRQWTPEAVKRLLLRETQVQPVLLVFEDLHWIDPETQTLLDSLIESLPSARMLLLVSYRPEYRHAWGQKTYYSQIRLDPLPPVSTEELLQDLLGDDDSLQPLKKLLIGRTEGNPFFLEESVRTLVETGVLAGERGACYLMQPLEAIQVPDTVRTVLAARIDRLPPEEEALLKTASVIGKDVSFTLLEAIVEEPGEVLRRGLANLQAAEFLYEARLFPDPEYTFKHALTFEVTYQSLLRDRRHALHRRVLQTLEQQWAGREQEKIELLAYHAGRGELWDRAARYRYLAGEKALTSADYRGAAPFFEAAVAALEQAGEASDPVLELDACLELWVARFELSRDPGLSPLAEKMEALALRLGDRGRLAKVRLRQAQGSRLLVGPGALDTTIARATEAFALAASDDLRTRSYARYLAAVAKRDLGRLPTLEGSSFRSW
jgi:class 3 adenylate cyclase